MLTVPIPGRIWRTTVIFKLTFKELLYLSTIPIVVIFPTFYIPHFPIHLTILQGVLATLGIIYIGLRTPEGQNPLQWAPSYFKQRLLPNTYYLKPRMKYRARPEYIDTVHTEKTIKQELNIDQTSNDSRNNQQ